LKHDLTGIGRELVRDTKGSMSSYLSSFFRGLLISIASSVCGFMYHSGEEFSWVCSYMVKR
jgi:hypothetical protein